MRSAPEAWSGPLLGLPCTMLGKRPKILIADDEPEPAQLLIDVLEPDGYELFMTRLRLSNWRWRTSPTCCSWTS